MRPFFAIILMAMTAASAANASSFVMLKGLDTPVSASMVLLGETKPVRMPAQTPDIDETDSGDAVQPPGLSAFGRRNAPPPDFIVISNSVIAMDEIPPIAFENVASIGKTKDPRTGREALPMVIRGGIAGDAFVSHSAISGGSAPVVTEPQQQVSAPSSAGDGAPSGKPEPKEPEPSQLPKEALPPSAAPTGRVE